jgi:hypothetical protein
MSITNHAEETLSGPSLVEEAVSKEQVVQKQEELSWMSDDPVINARDPIIKKARGIAGSLVASNWGSAIDSAPEGSFVGINGVRMFNKQFRMLSIVPFRYNFLHSAIVKVLQQGKDFKDSGPESLLVSDGNSVNWFGDFAIKGLLTKLQEIGLTFEKLAPNLKVRAIATFKYNELLRFVEESLGLLPSVTYMLVAEYAYDSGELESETLLNDSEKSYDRDLKEAGCDDGRELILTGRFQ